MNDNQALLKIVIESWRFLKIAGTMLKKLDAVDQKRFSGRIQWYGKVLNENLETLGYKIVDLVGKEYDIGMAATPINIDEFVDGDVLVVDQVLEPTVIDQEGHVVSLGTVMLKKEGE